MHRSIFVLLALALSVAASGCGREKKPSGAGAAGPAGTQGPDCNIQALMAAPENSCTKSRCHGSAYSGGLDLLSPGFEEKLVGAVAQNPACGGGLLIDPNDPAASVLLRRIDPKLAALGQSCGPMMPRGSDGVGEKDLQCFETWVHAVAKNHPNVKKPEHPFEASNIDSALTKVKTLVSGAPVTRAERASVKENPAELKRLLQQWIGEPAFEQKMSAFFAVALQQRLAPHTQNELFKLRGKSRLRQRLYDNLEQSFVRTAWDLVQAGKPLTEIATTRRWAATTGLLVGLSYLDHPIRKRANGAKPRRVRDHRLVSQSGNSGAPLPRTLAESIRTKVWVLPKMTATENCNKQIGAPELLKFFFGFAGRCGKGRVLVKDTVLTQADFSDWRFVDLNSATAKDSKIPFYDLPRLRKAKSLQLELPRIGFFTTPAFLSNWPTNEDNEFRVTVNQALIAGLGLEFTGGDATKPVSAVGLDDDHVAPKTDCYACHSLLDPMRAYFGQSFSTRYTLPAKPTKPEASFAFYQARQKGGDLATFAKQIANHPRFAAAWVQKLCYYANSQPCSEHDPEFIRVENSFTQSNFNFKTLVQELLASPLVTGLTTTKTHREHEFLVSIRRQQHLCQSLSAGLGVEDACGLAKGLVGLIPEDDFSRGEKAPIQAGVTSLFHSAATEQLCARLARRLVGNGKKHVVKVKRASQALDTLSGKLMGLEPGHPRQRQIRAELENHFNAALAAGAPRPKALRSTFTLACVSPDVMALGL